MSPRPCLLASDDLRELVRTKDDCALLNLLIPPIALAFRAALGIRVIRVPFVATFRAKAYMFHCRPLITADL